MSQQVVDVAVINKLLDLPLDTKIETTLYHINELLIFRQNHQYCKSIISNLQTEVVKIKIHLESQIAKFIKEKIEMTRASTQAISKSYAAESKIKSSLAKIPASLDKFMEEQFECKLKTIKEYSRKFNIIHSLKLCVVPSSHTQTEQHFQKFQNPINKRQSQQQKIE